MHSFIVQATGTKAVCEDSVSDSYRIGDTYSMLVYDIKPDEFEYAFSFDGPYEPAKGLFV